MQQGGKKMPNGRGNIRLKTVFRNGKQYTYYEGRVTLGTDPKTGKQIQKSVTGKTQKDVVARMNVLLVGAQKSAVNRQRMTVAEWLAEYEAKYTIHLEPKTQRSYSDSYRLYIIPAIGDIRLSSLEAADIQNMIVNLTNRTEPKLLSPKTIKIAIGALNVALEKAVVLGYIPRNPRVGCELPKARRLNVEEHVLMDDELKAFLGAIEGHKHQYMFFTLLFTGLREGEICGLRWRDVDLDHGVLSVRNQLTDEEKYRMWDKHGLKPLKTTNGMRSIALSEAVVHVLKFQREKWLKQKEDAGSMWVDTDLVFCQPDGMPITKNALYQSFKRLVRKIGLSDKRVHDCRHSYAVISLENGDDIKTLSGNLGHYDVGFSLSVYGHVSDRLKAESAKRMDDFIQSLKCAS